MSDIIEQFPAFLREILEKEYGNDVERIFAGYAANRPVTLRANALKASAEEVSRALEEMGISFSRVAWYEDAFVLPAATERDLWESELYQSGKIYLQSLSSMLPPLALAPKAGERVLDMTAAPGGKTTQLSALSKGGALITACERDKIRFERMKFNFARQGAGQIAALLTAAEKLDPYFRFDKILLDAPCSGSGTLRLSSPVKISPKLLENSVRAQRALLKKAAQLLNRGGVLVYSTCSVLKEENEEALFSVMRAEGLSLLPLPGEFSALPRLSGGENTLTVCPDGLFEGFFVAKLIKE